MLRDGGMKTSITELLTLLEALKQGIAGTSVDDFYYLARATLVKDESAAGSLRSDLRRILQRASRTRLRTCSRTYPRSGCSTGPSCC